MIITDEHRMTLIKVMQRAAQVDISELMETELLRGAGGRVSPARAFDTLGDIKAIKEWDPDIPYRAIHWGLSLKENPMKKMAVVRKRENRIDWCLVHDASITMDFGTLDLTKRAFGLALGAIFSQAALKKCDRVAEVVFDDKKIGVLLEDASTEEMVLVGLAYDPANSLLRIPIDPSKNGISMSMTQLPEDRGIVPIISDFLQLLRKDRKGRLTEAAQSAREAITRASRFHTVLGCIIEDPRECWFPDSQAEITMQDSSGARDTMTFAEANALMAADRTARLAELKAFFEEIRCPFAVFSPDDDAPEMRRKLLELMILAAATLG